VKTLVLGVRTYDFTGRDGGRVSGAQVAYVDPEEESNHGLSVILSHVSLDGAKMFAALPGLYDLEFDLRPGSKLKAEIKLKRATLIRSVDIASLCAHNGKVAEVGA
jgi:hypothetical protein